jgi:hypothetical protein
VVICCFFLFVFNGYMKITKKVRNYRSLGQTRNFLLGGESGMGKTTYQEWRQGQKKSREQEEEEHLTRTSHQLLRR